MRNEEGSLADLRTLFIQLRAEALKLGDELNSSIEKLEMNFPSEERQQSIHELQPDLHFYNPWKMRKLRQRNAELMGLYVQPRTSAQA